MQAQQQLEGQAGAAPDGPEEPAPQGLDAGSPKTSPRVLGRTATPARSNLLQLLTDNIDQVCYLTGLQATNNI